VATWTTKSRSEPDLKPQRQQGDVSHVTAIACVAAA
jgi:hypothetical protein